MYSACRSTHFYIFYSAVTLKQPDFQPCKLGIMNFFHPKQFTPLCIKTLNQITCICTNACSDV